MRIADTRAAELAAVAWLVEPRGIRTALANGLPGDVSLEDVGEWSQPALEALLSAPTRESFEARLAGAIGAALIVGAKLNETGGT